MNHAIARRLRPSLPAGWVLVALGLVPQAAAQTAGTAFTYQGRLADAGSPANGPYDFQLVLYTASVGGSQVGPVVTLDDVAVVDGLFAVNLDFGSGAFDGDARFLEIGVRPGPSTGGYTLLGARQELKPAPHSVFSQATPWTGVSGKPPGFADDTDNDALGGLSCANGQVAKWNGAAWNCAADANTTYTAGPNSGLVLNGTAFGLMTCSSGQVVKAGVPAGTWACASDIDTNTTYTAAPGGGLSLSGGNAFSVIDSVVARKDAAAGNQFFDTSTLVLDYANNRVGIGAVAPAAPLDVNGTARASSFALSSTQTGTYFVAGNSLVPELDHQGEEWSTNSSGFGYIGGGTALYALPLSAAVHPPNGATVTSLFCNYYDNDVVNGVTFNAGLYVRAFSAQSGGATAFASASTTPADASSLIRTITDSSVINPIVDTNTNAYYIYIVWQAAPDITTSLRLYGCGITYTYTTLVN